MATGDRIMIADKDTLDRVKQDTSDLKKSISDVSTELQDLNTTMSSTSIGIDNDRRSKLFYSSKVSGAGTWLDIVNITGQSGQLYAVVALCQPSGADGFNNTTTVNVIIDNNQIYNGVLTLGPSGGVTNMCLATKPAILSVQGSNLLTLITGQTVGIGSNTVPYANNNGNTPNIIASESIRFNNSLRIQAQGTRVSATVWYYYELD